MRTLLAFVLLATPLLSQKSPHETVTGTAGSAHITVTYGRPSLRNRTVGKEIAPYGEVWRLGADAATTLTTDKDITLGTLAVPAGTYALFALPSASGWKLIVNKTAKQWGLDYDKNKAEDLGQTDLNVTKLPQPVEQFTMAIADGKLKFMWGTTAAEAPIKVQ
ncbi:MAG: DUF2911 domain-containing protein [Acidobacteriota bacterium]|nr:DUF2911 domain-containing protein [Acidobacteriota bacterium]